MQELFIKQQEFFEKYNIVITIFPFQKDNRYYFRSYFTDLNKKYIHNPIDKEKKIYPYDETYEDALKYIIGEIEKTLN